MKKLSSIIALSLVLTMVLGMTAFAGESPKTDATSKTDGVTVSGEYKNMSSESLNEAYSSVNLGADVTPKYVYAFELKGDVPKNGVVELSYSGLDASKTYKALHYNSALKAWEVLDVEVGNGTVKIKGVTNFSPFILVRLEETGDSGTVDDEEDEAPAPATPVSPKTGETLPYAAVITLIALAGAFAAGRKKALAAR